MNIGTRIHAPRGCPFFPKGQELYFLSGTFDPPRILLVYFQVKMSVHGQTPRKGHLLQLNRPAFEEVCARGMIEETPEQPELPSWIEVHGSAQAYVLSHPNAEDIINERERAVKEAVKEWNQILVARDPEKHLAAIARKLKTNVSRYRLMVFAYVLFGYNRLALTPLHSNGGRWSRESKVDCKKLGRPSLSKGKHYGVHLDVDQLRKIEKAYKKHQRPGVPLSKIYADAMREEWGCDTIKVGVGGRELIQREGKPFPSLHQFRYHLRKVLGPKQLQIDRYGSARFRNRLAGNRGSFSARVANLMEEIEYDAFTARGCPVAIDGTVLPPLYVVRARDLSVGKFVGIGFSLGAERRSAYEMALFSMALDKRRFCALFGIDIDPQDWPSQGLPAKAIFDRGVGAGISEIGPIRELAPSHSGQSKAGIETSHQKEDHREGAPSYLWSGKTPFEMAAAIILETIAANQGTNMRSRLSPRMRHECETATPLELWKYFDLRGRNLGVRVGFDAAVRKWLQPFEMKCGPNGVMFYGTLYMSEEFRETGLLDQAKSHVVELKGYVMPMGVRQIWIDYKGRLYELQLCLPLVDEDSQRNMTLHDLRVLAEHDSVRESRMRGLGPAALVAAADHYEQTFGKPWESSELRLGRAKPRTARARSMAEAFDIPGRRS